MPNNKRLPFGGREGAAKKKKTDETLDSSEPSQQERIAVIHIFSKALGFDDEARTSMIPESCEEALHDLHQGSVKAYKVAVRNLTANFKRNAELVSRIRSGKLTPHDLVRLDPHQLATSEQQANYQKAQSELLRLSTLSESLDGQATSEYVCPECKSTSCSFLDTSRRDVGKSETWRGGGDESGERVVRCQTCSHRWRVNFLGS